MRTFRKDFNRGGSRNAVETNFPVRYPVTTV
jgi:hypothetical protein